MKDMTPEREAERRGEMLVTVAVCAVIAVLIVFTAIVTKVTA